MVLSLETSRYQTEQDDMLTGLPRALKSSLTSSVSAALPICQHMLIGRFQKGNQGLILKRNGTLMILWFNFCVGSRWFHVFTTKEPMAYPIVIFLFPVPVNSCVISP